MNGLKIKIFFVFLSLIADLYSQNLISNYSFEDYKKKKKQVIKIEDLKYCYNPSQATPDLLTPYSKNTWWTAPKNATGFQLSHSGESYIGLYPFYQAGLDRC